MFSAPLSLAEMNAGLGLSEYVTVCVCLHANPHLAVNMALDNRACIHVFGSLCLIIHICHRFAFNVMCG